MVRAFLQVLLEYILAVIITRFTEHGVDMIDGARIAARRVAVVKLDEYPWPMNAIVIGFALPHTRPGEINIVDARATYSLQLRVSNSILIIVHILPQELFEEKTL